MLQLLLFASDGDLDMSFGTDGIVITNVGNNSSSKANSLAIQSDGKILAAGTSYYSGGDFTLIRYNSNGTIDTSFGNVGTVVTDVGGNSEILSIVLQSDEKILAVGNNYANSGHAPFTIVRYNSDGSRDASFGSHGQVNTHAGDSSHSKCVAVQDDNKIIVAGYSHDNDTRNNAFTLMRHFSNGLLDRSFDTDGIVITDVGISSNINSISIQNDGKIVAGGRTQFDSAISDFALVRYNSNGSLDTSFGTNGKVITKVEDSNDHLFSIAIQSDGKILAAGGSYSKFALLRYNSNGSLDTSFGTEGKFLTDAGNNGEAYAYSLAIQNDGKIVLAGYSRNNGIYNFTLIRCNSNGTIDTSFGTDGIAITSVRGYDFAKGVAIQNNGKIVAVGTSAYYSDTQKDFTLIRYMSTPLALTPIYFLLQ